MLYVRRGKPPRSGANCDTTIMKQHAKSSGITIKLHRNPPRQDRNTNPKKDLNN